MLTASSERLAKGARLFLAPSIHSLLRGDTPCIGRHAIRHQKSVAASASPSNDGGRALLHCGMLTVRTPRVVIVLHSAWYTRSRLKMPWSFPYGTGLPWSASMTCIVQPMQEHNGRARLYALGHKA